MSSYKTQKTMAHGDLFPRVLDIEVCSKSLTLFQRLEGDVNCVVWDASIVLAKYLEVMSQKSESLLNGLKILELGSGVGCVGLTAATLGAEVTLTDLPEALPLLRCNIAENKSTLVSQGGFATAEALAWGDLDSEIVHNMDFDYVLLADCVYYEESIDPLIMTLCNLNTCSGKKAKILITQEQRDSDIQRGHWATFFEKLKTFFQVENVPKSQQHPEYCSDDILILCCTRTDVT